MRSRKTGVFFTNEEFKLLKSTLTTGDALATNLAEMNRNGYVGSKPNLTQFTLDHQLAVSTSLVAYLTAIRDFNKLTKINAKHKVFKSKFLPKALP